MHPLEVSDLIFIISKHIEYLDDVQSFRSTCKFIRNCFKEDRYIIYLKNKYRAVKDYISDSILDWLLDLIHTPMTRISFQHVYTRNVHSISYQFHDIGGVATPIYHRSVINLIHQSEEVNRINKRHVKSELMKIIGSGKVIIHFNHGLYESEKNLKVYRWWFSLSYNIKECQYARFTKRMLYVNFNKISKQILKEELSGKYSEIKV